MPVWHQPCADKASTTPRQQQDVAELGMQINTLQIPGEHHQCWHNACVSKQAPYCIVRASGHPRRIILCQDSRPQQVACRPAWNVSPALPLSRQPWLCRQSHYRYDDASMFSSQPAPRWVRRYVTRLSCSDSKFCATMLDAGVHLFEHLDQLRRRARRCPIACLLKVLLIVSFTVALNIAVYFQGTMSFHEYSAFVVVIAYIAILVIITNTSCRLDMPGQK